MFIFFLLADGIDGCQVIHKFNCKAYNDGRNPSYYYQNVTGTCDLNSEAFNAIKGQDCCE